MARPRPLLAASGARSARRGPGAPPRPGPRCSPSGAAPSARQCP